MVRDVSCTADQCFSNACSLSAPSMWPWHSLAVVSVQVPPAEVWQDLLPAVDDRRRMLVVRGVQVEGQNLW